MARYKALVEVEIEANSLEEAIRRMKMNGYYSADKKTYGYPEDNQSDIKDGLTIWSDLKEIKEI